MVIIMTNTNVFAHALSLIGETEGSLGIDDYSERAPLLLAGIIGELSQVETELGGDMIVYEASVDMQSEFPLDNRLSLVAAHMLAARLVFDEMPELSAELSSYANKITENVLKDVTDISSIREVY